MVVGSLVVLQKIDNCSQTAASSLGQRARFFLEPFQVEDACIPTETLEQGKLAPESNAFVGSLPVVYADI